MNQKTFLKIAVTVLILGNILLWASNKSIVEKQETDVEGVE